MTDTTLGHYRITHELGRGGMGIVYRAEDTKLERTVAIKVLPQGALSSEDDRARFYREAKAAAQLNHPNIAAIHQIDEAVPEGSPPATAPSPFIAMEFIDGSTLGEQLKDRPFPIDEAIRLTKAIASALQVAHEKNIVHRDIKSANVMLTAKGVPKVLDFGLAKTTHSTMLTRMGSTLGTVAYMSPEQARGEEVDGRSDLWSLGVVLYEMVTGRVPFSTDYEQAAVYSILNEDPQPLTALRTGVPMELERIALKLLSKDPKHRHQSAADLIADLDALELFQSRQQTAVHPSPAIPAAAASNSNRPATPWALIVASLLLVGVGGWWLGRSGGSGQVESPTRHSSVIVPEMDFISHPTLSPDGRYLVFTTNRRELWLYDFENGQKRELGTSANARMSAFSPDGRWLAFESQARSISIVQIPEGRPALLMNDAVLPSWIDNDWLLVANVEESGLNRYNRITGENEVIYTADDSHPPLTHPHVLPDGRHALVSIMGDGGRQVGVLDLSSGEVSTLIDDAFAPRYMASGHIVFSRGSRGDSGYEGEVYVQPFDVKDLRVLGQPLQVLGTRGYWMYGVNTRGDMVSLRGNEAAAELAEREVYLYDRDRNNLDVTGLTLPDQAEHVQLTMDEEWILYVDQDEEEIMIGRVEDERFAPLPGVNKPLINAFLSRDDTHVFYTHGQVGTGLSISVQPIDGSSPPRTLDLGLSNHQLLFDVYQDEKVIVGHFEGVGSNTFLEIVDLNSGQRTLLSDGEDDIPVAQFSPDGKWVAIHDFTDEGYRTLVSSADGGDPWVISEEHGWPSWSADGSGLYLFSGMSLWWTEISTERGVRAEGDFREVYPFEGSAHYWKRRDSETILLLSRETDPDRETPAFDIVQSWGEQLKRLAPVD